MAISSLDRASKEKLTVEKTTKWNKLVESPIHRQWEWKRRESSVLKTSPSPALLGCRLNDLKRLDSFVVATRQRLQERLRWLEPRIGMNFEKGALGSVILLIQN